MGSKAPPIPPDQRSMPGDKPHVEGPHGGGRQAKRSDHEVSLKARQGNTHHQGQDR